MADSGAPPGPAVLTAWQCIGCGKLDSPQPCIGVCKDRKVELMYRADYERLAAEAAALRDHAAAIEAILSRLAHVTPREGEWERTYRALQAQARILLRS